MEDELTEAPDRGASLGRRGALGVGLGGALGAVFAAATARATTPDTGPTTTTTPPLRPTTDDVVKLDEAQGTELAARDLYTAALALDGLDDTHRTVFTVFRDAHDAFGQSFSGLLGRNANQVPSTGLDGLKAAFTKDPSSAVAAAAKLEMDLAGMHRQTVGALTATGGAALLASIAISEARHAVVLEDMAGQGNG